MSEFELLNGKERILRAQAADLEKESAEISRRREAVEADLRRVAEARALLKQLFAGDSAPGPEPEEGPVDGPGADEAGPDDRAGGEERDAEAVSPDRGRGIPEPLDLEDIKGAQHRVVTLLATSGRKMRARAIAEAIGEDVSTPARVETTRGRLKALVKEGTLMEDPAGVFFIATAFGNSA
ncbi:hypothetical protein [Streptomyces termitum]|uniref:hypothetical protein n=1 Tax=Streptomyces termitum TaxID=67368 RepID=UPI0037A8E589